MKTAKEVNIEAHLLALQSNDANERALAFDAVKDVPKADLEAAWQSARAPVPIHGGRLDCFNRVEVVSDTLEFERAIVTVISPGFEALLGHLLRSLARVGNTVPVVAFCLDESYENMAGWPDLIRVRCHSRERIDASVKGVVYSCARWIKAKHIVSLEADMFALESLDSLWGALEQTIPGTLAGVRPQVVIDKLKTLQSVLNHERAQETLLPWLGDASLHFNGGLLAGDYAAWQQLDEILSGLGSYASIFLDGAMRAHYTDEMLMNFAADQMNRLELSAGWNVQFYSKDRQRWITTLPTTSGRRYECHGSPAKILHFLTHSREGADNLLNVFLSEIGENDLRQRNTSQRIKCRSCRVSKTCSNCFEPSTFALQRLRSGEFSALCRVCFAARTGASPESVPLDIRMEVTN